MMEREVGDQGIRHEVQLALPGAGGVPSIVPSDIE